MQTLKPETPMWELARERHEYFMFLQHTGIAAESQELREELIKLHKLCKGEVTWTGIRAAFPLLEFKGGRLIKKWGWFEKFYFLFFPAAALFMGYISYILTSLLFEVAVKISSGAIVFVATLLGISIAGLFACLSAWGNLLAAKKLQNKLDQPQNVQEAFSNG